MKKRRQWQAWACVSKDGRLGVRSIATDACAIYFREDSAQSDCQHYLRVIAVTITERKAKGGGA